MRYYRTGAHTTYDCKVHLIWIPKYRKRVLTGAIALYARDIIRQICTQYDLEIISGKVAPDHVHLFLSFPPQDSIGMIMQRIKGKSSYKILAEFSHLRKIFWDRHFWARGYLAVTSGNITDEIIQRYIEEQEGEDIHQGPIDCTP